MQKLIKAIVGACLAIAATASMAAPVLLGSIEHLYGTAPGRVVPTIFSEFHPGGNCDTANATSITVTAKASTSCNRFGDIFNFSSVDYDSIDYFTVTLVFAGARDQLFGLERWNVRASPNYVQTGANFGPQLNASGTQSFDLTSTTATFNSILSAQQLMLAFATNSGTASTFNLTSARVDIFGTAAVSAVPEPGTLALLGLSLAAVVAIRKRKQR